MRRDTGEEVVILPPLRSGEREDAPGPGFEILGRVDVAGLAALHQTRRPRRRLRRHRRAGLLRLLEGASWRPVLDSVRPLAEAEAALARLESGQHFGKLVLTV